MSGDYESYEIRIPVKLLLYRRKRLHSPRARLDQRIDAIKASPLFYNRARTGKLLAAPESVYVACALNSRAPPLLPRRDIIGFPVRESVETSYSYIWRRARSARDPIAISRYRCVAGQRENHAASSRPEFVGSLSANSNQWIHPTNFSRTRMDDLTLAQIDTVDFNFAFFFHFFFLRNIYDSCGW